MKNSKKLVCVLGQQGDKYQFTTDLCQKTLYLFGRSLLQKPPPLQDKFKGGNKKDVDLRGLTF